MYTAAVNSYYRNSTHRGTLEHPDASGQSQFPPCGDKLSLELQIENNTIRTARFHGHACAPSIAVAALGAELLTGATLEEARLINSFQLDKLLGGLPPSKRHAYLMFLDCLNQALAQFPPTN